MSRIGKLPISIPAGVTVTLRDNVVTVKGPKGEMSQYVNPAINVEMCIRDRQSHCTKLAGIKSNRGS